MDTPKIAVKLELTEMDYSRLAMGLERAALGTDDEDLAGEFHGLLHTIKHTADSQGQQIDWDVRSRLYHARA